MPLARTSIAIDAELLRRFNAAYRSGERSRVLQRLIAADLADREARLAAVARLVEEDATFHAVRRETDVWEATVADGLSGDAD